MNKTILLMSNGLAEKMFLIYKKNKSWEVINEKIIFPNEKGRTWKIMLMPEEWKSPVERHHIWSVDMIPLLAKIELQSRMSLLDRKMRVVNENVDNEDEWIKWAERAFQSIYGYEYQGDNLLLAVKPLYTY